MNLARLTVRFSLFALICVIAAFAQQPTLYLGAVEDIPALSYSGTPARRMVRAAFFKEGNDWKAFPVCDDDGCLSSVWKQYPAEVNWTVGFDGKSLGSLTARTPKGYEFYSDVGLQEITKGTAPNVGKRSQEYSGFLDELVYRPLIVSSHADVADPEQWKPAPLAPNLFAAIRKEFRAKYTKVYNCKGDGTEEINWTYKDTDISLLKAYGSNRGWFVARVELQGDHCEGPPDDPFTDQWYAISPDGKVQHLDFGMWLVDAGDYDADGHSELIFSFSRENQGGYEMFYADFSKSATFLYTYH